MLALSTFTWAIGFIWRAGADCPYPQAAEAYFLSGQTDLKFLMPFVTTEQKSGGLNLAPAMCQCLT